MGEKITSTRNRQTDRYMDGWTDGQADRWTDRQADRHDLVLLTAIVEVCFLGMHWAVEHLHEGGVQEHLCRQCRTCTANVDRKLNVEARTISVSISLQAKLKCFGNSVYEWSDNLLQFIGMGIILHECFVVIVVAVSSFF